MKSLRAQLTLRLLLGGALLLGAAGTALHWQVRRALRHAGFAVDTAADGAEGLALAELNDYDALVLDVMLPKLDGLAVLRRLRAAGKISPRGDCGAMARTWS